MPQARNVLLPGWKPRQHDASVEPEEIEVMLQVTFRHMSASAALRVVATELLEKLQTRAHGVERCHLVVDRVTAQHDHKPALISAHVDISFGFPDSLFHATSTQVDAGEAVREAFASIERQLTDRQKRHQTEARVDVRS